MTSGFKRIHSKLEVHLAPLYTQKIAHGVHDYLSALLTKYNHELKGVVLSFSNIKILNSKSIIKSESPYLHIPITVDFLVFQPSVNDVLIGIVNKTSPDHVGCLVHGAFNASIASDQFPPSKYTWDAETHVWKSKRSIKPGSIVKFKCTKLITSNDILTIRGSLLETGCGVVDSEGMTKPPVAMVAPIAPSQKEEVAVEQPSQLQPQKIVFGSESESENDEEKEEHVSVIPVVQHEKRKRTESDTEVKKKKSKKAKSK